MPTSETLSKSGTTRFLKFEEHSFHGWSLHYSLYFSAFETLNKKVSWSLVIASFIYSKTSNYVFILPKYNADDSYFVFYHADQGVSHY